CASRTALRLDLLRRRAGRRLAAPVRPSCLLAPVPRDRPPASWRSYWTTRARLPASLRHPNAARLVSGRQRRRAATPGALHLSRPRLRTRHVLVSLDLPGVDGTSGAAPRSAMGGDAMKPTCNVATLIERYFTERLMRQRNVSANTIAS